MLAAMGRLSVNARLLIAALILVGLILPLAGIMLSYNFKQSVTTAFDERLRSLLNVVIAGIEYDPNSRSLNMVRSLGDPRFERVFSGWYWQATDGVELSLTSRSLWDQRLAVSGESGLQLSNQPGPRGEPLRVIERDIKLSNLQSTLHLSVAASRQELDAEVDRFGRLLWLSLAGLGVLLLAGLAIQIRWGLSPLRRIRGNLREVENGQSQRLATDFPSELKALAEAINLVLERDEQLIERGRAAAGNLAHALKTPVTVRKTHCERLPEAQARPLLNELQRLDDAVRHHLARASAAGATPLTRTTGLSEALEAVVTGIGRMAQRRGLVLQSQPLPDAKVRMDAQDLQEIVGNLLENAVKWASTTVVFDCEIVADRLLLRIADDGAGLTEAQRVEALERGRMLDERRSGSGLGLAIVSELVALYGGAFELGTAEQGGLLATVSLPVTQEST